MSKITQIILFSIFIFFNLSTLEAKPDLKWQKNDSIYFSLRGGIRFAYNLSDWKKSSMKRGGEFGFDAFIFNPVARYKRISLDADFRFYAKEFGGYMLKYGWMGYDFTAGSQVQLGLSMAPFGLQPATGNDFFFLIPYYVGLEADPDMGVKYINSDYPIHFAFAFYKNADELLFGDDTETTSDRYGEDIGGRNKEINQLNGQLIWQHGNQLKHEVGLSAMYGQIFNLDTEKNGNRFAFALHYQAFWQNFNLRLQALGYDYHPINAPGEARNIVEVTACGGKYNIATRANIYTVSLIKTFPINHKYLKYIQVYNDYAYMQKFSHGMTPSQQNVTGCLLQVGPIQWYIDYGIGKNHPLFGGGNNALAQGSEHNTWHGRFNVNIGYYF